MGWISSDYNAIVSGSQMEEAGSGYYRQEEALLFDILHENARTFHGECAIIAAAEKLGNEASEGAGVEEIISVTG